MPRFDVTLAGELNLDLILYGLPECLPPERELLAREMTLTLGGSSTIVAHNLAALGCQVGFISLIGADDLGQIAMNQLRGNGVDVSKVKVARGAQTGITIVLQRDDWRNMLTHAGTIAELSYDDLDLDYLADSKHFHLSSFYLQRALQPKVAQLFRELKARGLTVSMDTNDDPDDAWCGMTPLFPYLDVFLPNAREAKRIAGLDDLHAAVEDLAKKVPLVVVKLGEDGALAQKGREQFRADAVPVRPTDAVGAGDSFDAGFLSQYVRGASLKDCLRAGNLAGALSTTRAGGVDAFRDQAYREGFFRTHI